MRISFLMFGVSNSYIWRLRPLAFGGCFFYVLALVFLRFEVSNSYVWGSVFLILGVRDSYV